MRIKSVRLRDYKRFTDLTITDLPNRARLVVLVGPNGAGKSSVFDSFLLKAKAAFGNYAIVGNLEMEEYYDKLSESQTTQDIANRVDIELHGINASDVNWKSAFHVRSAYRNEADFRLTQLQAPPRDEHQPRLGRIIDPDLSVSANYGRMVWKRLGACAAENHESGGRSLRARIRRSILWEEVAGPGPRGGHRGGARMVSGFRWPVTVLRDRCLKLV